MKFTVERAVLIKALAHVQSVVERRNTIPILANVLLAAQDDALRLTATDMEIAVVEEVPGVQVARPGRTTAPAATLYEIVRKLPEGARVLDVGGGPGTNAEVFAAGGASVTVFDRPEVIDLMRETLAASGIKTEAGDMNEGLPGGPFEAIYFGNTSHMYGPGENRSLFFRMRRSLVPGGLLAVREYLRGSSEDAALFAVNMLALTPRGGTYTAGDYEAWLREAGYDDVAFEPVPGRSSHLVFARNPETTRGTPDA